MVNNFPSVKKRWGRGERRVVASLLSGEFGCGSREGLGLAEHCDGFLYMSLVWFNRSQLIFVCSIPFGMRTDLLFAAWELGSSRKLAQ